MQTRQRIFKFVNMQVVHFVLDKNSYIFEVLTYYTLFCHKLSQNYQLSITVGIFLAHHLYKISLTVYANNKTAAFAVVNVLRLLLQNVQWSLSFRTNCIRGLHMIRYDRFTWAQNLTRWPA